MRFHLIQTGLGLGEGEWEEEGNPPSVSAIFPNFSVSTSNRQTDGKISLQLSWEDFFLGEGKRGKEGGGEGVTDLSEVQF